ncbi:MAG: 2-phospho-L-lactate transferase [Anaerolineae bacterium]|nr:2-phospho-L-lactate transferase [Anaerolineae bacterium]MDW8171420.1 2-phospho-L-lactate transferase [Anaerolineae bacterium]
MALNTEQNILLLVGGVGGAKLALGMQAILPPERLRIVVNTGDDFWHYGLKICPDLDTVLYTLSGRVERSQGWGVANDSTTALEALRAYGEDAWFRLGDKDIATHLLRTDRLRRGWTLSQVAAHLAAQMGISLQVMPMSDDDVPTLVETVEHGWLEFQEYFVRYRWQPTLRSLRYQGAETARLSQAVAEALAWASAVVIAPSNPWLSIAPMLHMTAFRQALLARELPRVAVTPIVQGQAIKGPTAKLMRELGLEPSPQAVRDYYGALINGFVYDLRDAQVQPHDKRSAAFDTMMVDNNAKVRLAQDILSWLAEW